MLVPFIITDFVLDVIVNLVVVGSLFKSVLIATLFTAASLTVFHYATKWNLFGTKKVHA